MLREQIIAGTAITNGRQLSLMLHEGMAAWLRAVKGVGVTLNGERAPVADASRRGLRASPRPRFPIAASMAGLVPPQHYAEAAALLAHMALVARKDFLR